MSKQPETFTLTVTAASGRWRAPVIVRLRAALKALLRAYGLRCVRASIGGLQNRAARASIAASGKNTDQKTHYKTKFAASAAVSHETGNFDFKDSVDGTPTSGVSESVLWRAFLCP
jgi:hypothetical protein